MRLCFASYLPIRAMLALVVVSTIVCIGCGGEEEERLGADELLQRYELERRRHDPTHFSEFDLGRFTVTKRKQMDDYEATRESDEPTGEDDEPTGEDDEPTGEDDVLHIRFHLFGVVPDKDLEQFGARIESHGERLRAEVRKTVQMVSEDNLSDPTLGWLKSELIDSINRSLETRLLRDVVFTNFSFERN